ncbi:MAG: metalloregulator ArsR/SmtB family transcription factor [Planctomycetota bacterium]
MVATAQTLPETLKLLGDPTRLRLLALLAGLELSVQELCTITGLQQSRISNHLSVLKRGRLVKDRREGSWSFHSLVEPGEGGLSPSLYEAVVVPFRESDAGMADRKALEAVMEQRRERSRRTHDQLAERWIEVGQGLVQDSLRSELLAQVFPAGFAVADLGCGTGFLTSFLAPRCARVIAVDHSERMVAAVRGKPFVGEVEVRRGELDALPLRDGEVDAVFANLVWHHLPDLAAAASEAFRVLKPGGTCVISDLLPHEAEWMRTRMGDLRLGLRPEEVLAALARAGFCGLAWERASDRYRLLDPDGSETEFPIFLVRGRRAAGAPPVAENRDWT